MEVLAKWQSRSLKIQKLCCQGYRIACYSGEPTFKWQIGNTKSFGGVSCIGNYDVTGDGVDDLLIGREDGTVQIFSYDATDEPVLQFSHVSLEIRGFWN